MFRSLNQSFIYFLEYVFIILIISILMLACWRNTSLVESTDPKDIQAYIPEEARCTYEALAGFIIDSGPLPSKYKITSKNHLTITTAKGTKMSIPEEYVHNNSMDSADEIGSLVLDFYFPYMESKKTIEARFSLADTKALEEVLNKFRARTLVVNVEKPANKFLFSEVIKDFQKPSGEINNQSNNIQPLKNGKYDTNLNLVAYLGNKELPWRGGRKIPIHTVYLKPKEDMNDPTEWIIYGDDIYLHCWMVDEYYIETILIPPAIAMHDVIRQRVDQKLEEFTKRTPLQNIKKGIINFGHLIYHLIFSSFKRAT